MVYKNLTITDIPCIKSFFRRRDNRIDRNPADDYFNLDFRKKRRIDFNAAVYIAGTFLNTASHNLCHRHTGNPQVIHRFFQMIISGQSGNNNNLIHSRCPRRIFRNDRNFRIFLCGRNFLIYLRTQTRIFVDIHCHCIGNIHNAESRIRGRKPMLTGIQSYNFLFFADTKPKENFNNNKRNRNRDRRPGRYRRKSDQL